MSVDFTARKPDFKNDIVTYGDWGENLFVTSYAGDFEKKGYTVFNVTKDPEYQSIDIDFVVSKDGDKEAPTFSEIMENPTRYETIEVKVDTRTIDTGNVPYEVISHAQPGWSLVTKCNKVFFIIARENGDVLTPISGLWIDMLKWEKYIFDKTTPKRCNFIKSENGIADLLCKLKDLRNYGVVISEKSFVAPASTVSQEKNVYL